MCKYQGDNGGEEFEVAGRLPLHVAGRSSGGGGKGASRGLSQSPYLKAAQTSDNQVICIWTCISLA